jgi:hypothetical protein
MSSLKTAAVVGTSTNRGRELDLVLRIRIGLPVFYSSERGRHLFACEELKVELTKEAESRDDNNSSHF